MKTIKRFDPLIERYDIDWNLCNKQLKYAQIDSSQDASYYGNWCSPGALTLIHFAEGDITIKKADTKEEFTTAIKNFVKWNNDAGYGPTHIDPGPHKDIAQALLDLGLGTLFHPSTLAKHQQCPLSTT